jgi:hypothetical protein
MEGKAQTVGCTFPIGYSECHLLDAKPTCRCGGTVRVQSLPVGTGPRVGLAGSKYSFMHWVSFWPLPYPVCLEGVASLLVVWEADAYLCKPVALEASLCL